MEGEKKAVAGSLLLRSSGPFERPFLGNRRIVQVRQLTKQHSASLPIPPISSSHGLNRLSGSLFNLAQMKRPSNLGKVLPQPDVCQRCKILRGATCDTGQPAQRGIVLQRLLEQLDLLVDAADEMASVAAQQLARQAQGLDRLLGELARPRMRLVLSRK